jgi:hypothetical protein
MNRQARQEKQTRHLNRRGAERNRDKVFPFLFFYSLPISAVRLGFVFSSGVVLVYLGVLAVQDFNRML